MGEITREDKTVINALRVANFFFPGAICHRPRVLRCDWLLVDLINAVNYHASQSVNKNNIS